MDGKTDLLHYVFKVLLCNGSSSVSLFIQHLSRSDVTIKDKTKKSIYIKTKLVSCL